VFQAGGYAWKLKTLPKQKSKKVIFIFSTIAVLTLSSTYSFFKNSILPGKIVAGAIKSLAILPFENYTKRFHLIFFI
jgi:hypothetical protein